MSVQPSAAAAASPIAVPSLRVRLRGLRQRVRVVGFRLLVFFVVLMTAGSSAIDYNTQVYQTLVDASSGWSFDLLTWEAQALAAKARALWTRPAAGLSDAEAADAVRDYLRRAGAIRRLEDEANRLLSRNQNLPTDESAALLAEVAALRAQQETARPVAEAAIERQITETLREAGIGTGGRVWPPVLFTFTESPRKLVVSPRERIVTAHYRMLTDAMPLDAVEATEAAVEASGDFSAYVARTGGMGAFPTMVIDDGSLPWILSTVAHEWVHTYLSFFPLGFNYGLHQDNVTINETVADIVGDEIGRRALARYYPEMVPPPQPPAPSGESAPALPAPAPLGFDFNAEMAQTRVMTDRLLAAGRVEDAEKYMELRRQLFVENGYHLRTLNQAYFAFHGAYGTGPAADVSSPDAVAPKVERLFELVARLQTGTGGDLRAFLHAVRGVVDADDLERVLDEIAAPD